jgi:hypothetical protein
MMTLAGALFLAVSPALEANEMKAPGAFDIPVAVLVDTPAAGYGMYVPRASNHYKAGGTVYFYLEPKNFKYADVGTLHRFGSVSDLLLIKGGTIVFGKKDFLNMDFKSHYLNKEIDLTGNLTLGQSAPGDYVLELAVRDIVSNEAVTVDLPFTIDP